MAKVVCQVPNGVMINLFKEGFDDGTGKKPMVRDGAGYRLAGPSQVQHGAGGTERRDLEAVTTEVPAEWMAKWLEQNKANPLVTMKQVYVLDEPPVTSANPTPAPAE